MSDNLIYRCAATGVTVDADYAEQHPGLTVSYPPPPPGAENPVTVETEDAPAEAPASEPVVEEAPPVDDRQPATPAE